MDANEPGAAHAGSEPQLEITGSQQFNEWLAEQRVSLAFTTYQTGRGMAIHDRYAFVGLSRIREKRQFGGLPIEERVDQMQCAVYAIDLITGQVAAFLSFESGCTELFDVQVLPGGRRPAVIGFQKETIDGIFVVPPGGGE